MPGWRVEANTLDQHSSGLYLGIPGPFGIGPNSARTQTTTGLTAENTIERVQIGVRIEKRMVQVLKGLAEFNGVSLGELLEKIVLYSFEPLEGHEGEACHSPHGKKALRAIAGLKRVYEMDYDVRGTHRL